MRQLLLLKVTVEWFSGMSIVVISCVLFVSVKQSRKDSVMTGVVEWSKHSTLAWFWMKSKRDCRGDELAFWIYTMRSLA